MSAPAEDATDSALGTLLAPIVRNLYFVARRPTA